MFNNNQQNHNYNPPRGRGAGFYKNAANNQQNSFRPMGNSNFNNNNNNNFKSNNSNALFASAISNTANQESTPRNASLRKRGDPRLNARNTNHQTRNNSFNNAFDQAISGKASSNFNNFNKQGKQNKFTSFDSAFDQAIAEKPNSKFGGFGGRDQSHSASNSNMDQDMTNPSSNSFRTASNQTKQYTPKPNNQFSNNIFGQTNRHNSNTTFGAFSQPQGSAKFSSFNSEFDKAISERPNHSAFQKNNNLAFGNPKNNTAFSSAFNNQKNDSAFSSNFKNPKNSSGFSSTFNNQRSNSAFSSAFSNQKNTSAFSSEFNNNTAFSSAFDDDQFMGDDQMMEEDQSNFDSMNDQYPQQSANAFSSPFGQNMNNKLPFEQKNNRDRRFNDQRDNTFNNKSQLKQKPQSTLSPFAKTFVPANKQTKRNDADSELSEGLTTGRNKQLQIKKQYIEADPELDLSDDMGTVKKKEIHSQPKLKQPIKSEVRSNLIITRTKPITQKEPVIRKEPAKITAADRAARFGSTSKSIIYDNFKKSRVQERQQAINDGLIPDPNNPTRLEDAIDFRGTCESKCPEFEMLEREIQNSLDSLEMDEEGNADPNKVVKAYRRSAAGNEQPLPSDVRTPSTLIFTLDYLINDVLANYPLEKCHAFIRDRTRSIRQDFTLQNIRDETAVEAHERIARFHILCLHEMCELDENKFSAQQETEQLRKVLLSLIEFYDDLREEGIECENEPEFRAYYMLTHIRDQDIARQAQVLPINVFRDPFIQLALKFYGMAQRNNEIMETSSRRNKPENIEACQNFYSKFFKLIKDKDTPFLIACLLETHFSEIRKGALKAMNASFMPKAGGLPAQYVQTVLAYDSLEQLLQEVRLYGIKLDMSLREPTLVFGQKHPTTKSTIFIEPLSNPSQRKSMLIIEPKKDLYTFQDIINNQAVENTREASSYNSSPKVPARAIPQTVSDTKSQTEDQNEKQVQLETLRARARAAAAVAAREREKMAEMIKAKELKIKNEKLKEEIERLEKEKAESRLQEEKRIAEEKRIQAQRAEEKKRVAQEKLIAQMNRIAEEKRQEEVRKQQAAIIRRKLIDEVAERLLNEVMTEAVENEVKRKVNKMIKVRKTISDNTRPWLRRVRQRIATRNETICKQAQDFRFDTAIVKNNPYSKMAKTYQPIPLCDVSTSIIQARVDQSMDADKYSLLSTNHNEDKSDAIWNTVNFTSYIYPRIRDTLNFKNIKDYQLLISVENTTLDSTKWFEKKFGLVNGNKSDVYYQNIMIGIRMVKPKTDITAQWAATTGSIIFSLPEFAYDSSSIDEIEAYWTTAKARFGILADQLQHFRPDINVPLLITVFPNTNNIERVLSEIPLKLGLDKTSLVKDFRFLIMNPDNISCRIVNEVNWLSSQLNE